MTLEAHMNADPDKQASCCGACYRCGGATSSDQSMCLQCAKEITKGAGNVLEMVHISACIGMDCPGTAAPVSACITRRCPWSEERLNDEL